MTTIMKEKETTLEAPNGASVTGVLIKRYPKYDIYLAQDRIACVESGGYKICNSFDLMEWDLMGDY